MSANVARGFGVEEAAVVLLNKATDPTTASSRTGEEDIVVTGILCYGALVLPFK